MYLETDNWQLETVVYLLKTGDWKLFLDFFINIRRPGDGYKVKRKKT